MTRRRWVRRRRERRHYHQLFAVAAAAAVWTLTNTSTTTANTPSPSLWSTTRSFESHTKFPLSSSFWSSLVFGIRGGAENDHDINNQNNNSSQSQNDNGNQQTSSSSSSPSFDMDGTYFLETFQDQIVQMRKEMQAELGTSLQRLREQVTLVQQEQQHQQELQQQQKQQQQNLSLDEPPPPPPPPLLQKETVLDKINETNEMTGNNDMEESTANIDDDEIDNIPDVTMADEEDQNYPEPPKEKINLFGLSDNDDDDVDNIVTNHDDDDDDKEEQDFLVGDSDEEPESVMNRLHTAPIGTLPNDHADSENQDIVDDEDDDDESEPTPESLPDTEPISMETMTIPETDVEMESTPPTNQEQPLEERTSPSDMLLPPSLPSPAIRKANTKTRKKQKGKVLVRPVKKVKRNPASMQTKLKKTSSVVKVSERRATNDREDDLLSAVRPLRAILVKGMLVLILCILTAMALHMVEKSVTGALSIP